MSNKNNNVTTILITGASAGLGEECARQLALKPTNYRIILACRNEERAKAAQNRLEASTGHKGFEIMIVDLGLPESVKRAVQELQLDDPIDALVLNAGGKGGKDHTAKTQYGVPSIVAANLTGHVLLVDLLLQQGKLSNSASVIYAGSEAARGTPLFGMPKPVIKEGTVEEFTALCDGAFYGKNNTSFEAMYSRTKLLAVFWMSDMARQHPNMRFVTISPGGTAGTNVLSEMPLLKRLVATILMPVMHFFGVTHSVQVGAQRYVDALTDEKSYISGIFYASRRGVSGEVADQVEFMPELYNETFQDNANTAIHKFVPV